MDSFLYLLYRYLSEEGQKPISLGLWFGGVGYLVRLAIGGITEPTSGGEHSQLFRTLIGLMPVGLEYNGEECQKSIIQEELV